MKPVEKYTHTVADYNMLFDMLRMMRPANSDAEIEFIKKFLGPLDMIVDGYGNLYKRIGTAPVAWSCHLDTVHRTSGVQLVSLGEDRRTISLAPESVSNCLGADDTAGVWLMVQMIRAKRPGLYVFHREEESGCRGSRWLVANHNNLFDGIECMIALDRRGFADVITKQLGRRCCSDEFGRSLAQELNKNGASKFVIDPTGAYTDSAHYTDLIGECTNISVGYENQHSFKECLDLVHMVLMRDTLLQLDVRDLTFKRKAGEKEPWESYYRNTDYNYGRSYHNSFHKASDHWQGGYFEDGKWVTETYQQWRSRKDKEKAAADKKEAAAANKKNIKQAGPVTHTRQCFRIDHEGKKVPDTLEDLIMDYPEEIALMLEDWGIDVVMLREEIKGHLTAGNVRGTTELVLKEPPSSAAQ